MNTERETVLIAALMSLMGAIGCIAFGCAVAGVDLVIFSFKEIAGMVLGLAGMFFGILMLVNFWNWDRRR